MQPPSDPYPASSSEGAPLLAVVVDTEEEFDWSRPFSRDARSVGSIASQALMHEVFRPRGIVPTYVVDYPVAAAEAARRFLLGLLDRGECEIGAHLHPWVNPPYEETVSARNSYPSNLPPALERAKLERLTRAIEAGFGLRPRIYKAGRYGLGPATPATLLDLGYEIDASVVPHFSFADDGGPDFRGWPDQPFWLGPEMRLLEVPLTRGFAGATAKFGPAVFPWLEAGPAHAARLGGIAARLRLLERIGLSPEGADCAALMRLTRALAARGRRIFCLCYHSPSLAPGNTPYVRTSSDLNDFIATASRYFDFFSGEMGGRFTTLSELRLNSVAARAA